MRFGSLLANAACVILLTGTPALAAQNGASLLPQMNNGTSLAAIAGVYAKNAKLSSTTIAKGSTTPRVLTAPQMALDPGTAITCPAQPAGKCIVEAIVTVQVADVESGNTVRLCTTLNGAAITGKCLAVGTMTDKHATMTLPIAEYNVAVGTFNVRSFVQADANATLGYYYVRYNVYK